MLHKEIGNLNEDTISYIVSYIENISGRQIDKTKSLVINYYNEPKKTNRLCMIGNLKNKVYTDFFKDNKDFFEISFAHADDYKKRKNLFNDKENLLRDTLFHDFCTCGNYIIIRPNGRFYRYYGEHRHDEVPKKALARW